MAENVTPFNEEAVKALVVNTSKVIKQYVDKQDGKAKVEATEALAGVEAKLQGQIDLIAKVDDEDGINTLAERLKAAEDALKNGDILVEVQNRFVAVEESIAGLSGRINAVEEGMVGLDVKITNNKEAVVALEGKLTSSIATSKTEAIIEAGKYSDALATELRSEINGGGEAVSTLTKTVEDNKASATTEITAAKTEVLEYVDAIAATKFDLSSALSEVEDLFGIKLESGTTNAL